MIAAVRAITKKHTSGKYHEVLSFEDFDHLGHVMTQSVDSLVTDSANSASSYSTGHKSSASALGVYADSSESPFDDPKVELLTELIRRRQPKKGNIIFILIYSIRNSNKEYMMIVMKKNKIWYNINNEQF